MRIKGFVQLVSTQATMLRRNTGFWLSSLIIAVVSILVFGWLFNPDTRPFDLAIVNEDGSKPALSLVAAFESADNVDVASGERDSELSSLEEGDRAALLIIPEGFGTSLGRRSTKSA